MSGVVIAETVRQHLRSFAFPTFAALLVIISLGMSQFVLAATGWPSLIVVLAIATGAGLIGPEFSSGRLQLTLVKPINRAVYLISRVTGVVLLVWATAILAALCELGGRRLQMQQAPAIGIALLNVMVESVLIVALLALLGSLTRAWYNVAIYLGAEVFLGILGGFASKLPATVVRAVTLVDRNLFPERPARLDPEWLLMVACNAAVALVLACLAFRRREVPYGAE